MNFFHNKTRDIALIIVGFLILCGLIFTLPAATKRAVEFKKRLDRSVVQVNLTPEQREEFEAKIKTLQDEIARKDTKGADSHARQYQEIGNHYRTLGLLAKAADAYTQSVKADSKSIDAYVARAEVEKEMGDVTHAEQDYRAALALDASVPALYHKLATFYVYTLKDEDKARGTYLEGLTRTKNSLELMKNFATFLEVVGDKYPAYLYWEAVVKREPSNGAARERMKYLAPLVQDAINAAKAVEKPPAKK